MPPAAGAAGAVEFIHAGAWKAGGSPGTLGSGAGAGAGADGAAAAGGAAPPMAPIIGPRALIMLDMALGSDIRFCALRGRC